MLLLQHIKLDDIQANEIYYTAATHYIGTNTVESNKSSKVVILYMQMLTSLHKGNNLIFTINCTHA